jgi:hypothetical protein
MDLCTVIEKPVGMDVFRVLHTGDDERVKRFFFATFHPLMMGV